MPPVLERCARTSGLYMRHGFSVERIPQPSLPAADAVKGGKYAGDVVQEFLCREVRRAGYSGSVRYSPRRSAWR